MKTAVILAAGMGVRLKERTRSMPKGFLEIDGLSLIERSINKLLDSGIKTIFIGTGYLSEHYEALAKKYPHIICIKNTEFANSGSMYTLYCMKNAIKDDFLLLESDLLYDKHGLKALVDDPTENIILASGRTGSGDEVFIETDHSGSLVNMSKDESRLGSVHAELVGITKISVKAFESMCRFSEIQFKTNLKLDYEYALVGIAPETDIHVKKIEHYAWCEIDDANHLNRALTKIYPLIRKAEEIEKS